MGSRQSPCCASGQIVPDGYAPDGRPFYVCSRGCAAGQHTAGGDGHAWDPRRPLAESLGRYVSDAEAEGLPRLWPVERRMVIACRELLDIRSDHTSTLVERWFDESVSAWRAQVAVDGHRGPTVTSQSGAAIWFLAAAAYLDET